MEIDMAMLTREQLDNRIEDRGESNRCRQRVRVELVYRSSILTVEDLCCRQRLAFRDHIGERRVVDISRSPETHRENCGARERSIADRAERGTGSQQPIGEHCEIAALIRR